MISMSHPAKSSKVVRDVFNVKVINMYVLFKRGLLLFKSLSEVLEFNLFGSRL